MTINPALNLLPAATYPEQPRQIFAQIARPPGTVNDSLTVTIPQLQQHYFWTIPAGEWPQLHGRTLPAAGAACLLLLDDLRHLRLVWWAGPYTASAPRTPSPPFPSP